MCNCSMPRILARANAIFCNTTTLFCATAIRLASYKQIRFRHLFNYETEFYTYDETQSSNYFGEAYVPKNLHDKARLQRMTNRAGAELELPYLGRTFLFGNAYFYNYYFQNAYFVSGVLQRHQIKDTDLSLGIQWHKKVGGFSIEAEGEQTFIGKMTGTKLSGKLAYAFNDKNSITAGAELHSAMPKFQLFALPKRLQTV